LAELDAAATLLLQPAVIAALIPASVAILTATATYTWTFVQARRQHASTRKRTVIALCTEIVLNVRDLDETLGRTDWKKIAYEIEAKPRPIYVVYSRNMRFYDRNHIEQLELPPLVLSAIVEFYSTLSSVYVQSDGIAGKVFPRISGQGRRQVLEDLGELVAKPSRTAGRHSIKWKPHCRPNGYISAGSRCKKGCDKRPGTTAHRIAPLVRRTR
jgi:hypothetical protein